MTATAPTDPVIDHSSLPSVALTDRQLGDLELLLSGAFAPLAGFMTSADAASVTERATLADGASFPVPVVLEVFAEVLDGDADHVLLADPEGTPIAVLAVTERSAGARPGTIRLAGPVTGHRAPEHGSFRRLMLTPEQARAALGDGPVLAFATRGPLGRRQIGQLRRQAEQLRARLLILPLVCGPAEVVRRPESLIRAVLAAAASLPADTLVVPVPLARRDEISGPSGAGPRNERELAVTAMVAAAYGASHLMVDAAGPGAGTTLPAPIPVIPAGDWAYDPRAEVWRPLSLIEAGTEIGDLSADQLGDMLDTGAPIPPWFAPDAVAAELRHARPPRSSRGFVLFLTGLSGSGKSTIARDLRDLLAERSDRRVSLLDGDLVRSLLSAGLSFSRADRDLNVARIGFVAAEIAKHGGIAICAPIAPYAQARARVREMVSEVGDFLLIHIATPIEVCEQRDRKGLYAKARAGLIEQFTGVSDPYEEPDDAMLVLDTSVLSREQATESVLRMLVTGGWLAER
ncbi:MAG: adenylyl-sulfate kinase [Actinomycetota bacterium]|nr:adenylyl-sulfate kinase [Actinomycetota bacterium]